MVHLCSILLTLLTLCFTAVYAQSPGPANASPNCNTYTDVASGSTVYYDPTDTDDIGIYLEGSGCDDGSYAQVQLLTPSGTYLQCGYAAVGDGSFNVYSCPISRGLAEPGDYEFQFLTNPASGEYSYNDITITHVQVTEIAATPTNTATSTPTTTSTSTVTTTATDTFTSTQTTITLPSGTVTNTFTITPRRVKTTITSTFTFHKIITQYAETLKTITTTPPCPERTPFPCAKKNNAPNTTKSKSQANRKFSSPRRRSLPGITPNNGEGSAGDGPLTTTVTPIPATTTATASTTSTATVTITTNALVDASTTVVNPTPTLTVFSGLGVGATTVTLPRKTITRTKFAYTKDVVVRTRGVTCTRTATEWPVCGPTGK